MSRKQNRTAPTAAAAASSSTSSNVTCSPNHVAPIEPNSRLEATWEKRTEKKKRRALAADVEDRMSHDDKGEEEEQKSESKSEQPEKKKSRRRNSIEKDEEEEEQRSEYRTMKLGIYSVEARVQVRNELCSTSNPSSPSILPDLADIILSYCYHPLLQLWESIEHICQIEEIERRLCEDSKGDEEEKTFEYYTHRPNREGENTEKSLAVSPKRVDILEQAYRVKLSDPHFQLPTELKILWSIRDGVDRNRRWMNHAHMAAQLPYAAEDDDDDNDAETCYQELFSCCIWPSISRVESIVKHSPTPMQSEYVILVCQSNNYLAEARDQMFHIRYDLPTGLFYGLALWSSEVKEAIGPHRVFPDKPKNPNRPFGGSIFVNLTQWGTIQSYHHLLSSISEQLYVPRKSDKQSRVSIHNFDDYRDDPMVESEYDRDIRFTREELEQIEERIYVGMNEFVEYAYIRRANQSSTSGEGAVSIIVEGSSSQINGGTALTAASSTAVAPAVVVVPVPVGVEWRSTILWSAQRWNADWDDEDLDAYQEP